MPILNVENPNDLEEHSDRVSVSFPGEEGVDWCACCGEQIEQVDAPGAAWVHCDPNDTDTPHWCDEHGDSEAEPRALHWANSAAIDWTEERIDVSISCGDPRGAFVMRLERMPDGSLRLSVPHPDDSLLHRELSPLASPGYYGVS